MRKQWMRVALVLVLCGVSLQARAQQVPEPVGRQALEAVAGPSMEDKDGGPLARVGFALAQLYYEHQAYRKHASGAPFRPDAAASAVRDEYVVVDAVAEEGEAGRLLAALEALGLRGGARYGRVVSGRLPIAALPEAARVPALRFARPAQATTLVGATTSQGDVAMRTDEARLLTGLDGTGMTVGILSDSYDCQNGEADDVASGDLPPDVTVLEEESGCGSATDEGRAMAQLVYDVVPGADLMFHSAFNGAANFAQGIIDLANAGSDVIVDDIIYFAEPIFQDGIIAQAADSVVSRGVPYYSSAGNNARQSYESSFRGSGAQGPAAAAQPGEMHDFDPGASVDTLQQITVSTGRRFYITFQWDESWYSATDGAVGSSSDLDIYLTNADGSVIYASSTESNVGGDPVEVLTWYNGTGSPAERYLVITRRSGSAPGTIKYVHFRNMSIDEYDTQSPSLYGHANAAGAVAVGASAYYNTPEYGVDPPPINSYSSVGGVPILFDTSGTRLGTPEVRQKPEIVGPDGANTTFFGSDIGADDDSYPNFFGTSAAAPHAAAVAALMLQDDPTLTPAQITAAMESTAIDMEAAGFDHESGHGFLQADRVLLPVTVDGASGEALYADRAAQTVASDGFGGTQALEVLRLGFSDGSFHLGLDGDLSGLPGSGNALVVLVDTAFGSPDGTRGIAGTGGLSDATGALDAALTAASLDFGDTDFRPQFMLGTYEGAALDQATSTGTGSVGLRDVATDPAAFGELAGARIASGASGFEAVVARSSLGHPSEDARVAVLAFVVAGDGSLSNQFLPGFAEAAQGNPGSSTVGITELSPPITNSVTVGDGAGWRMLAAPVTAMTVGAAAARNLVQGTTGSYPDAEPNLYTTYADSAWTAPADTSVALAPGRGFIWYFFDNDTATSVPLPFVLDPTGYAPAADVAVGSLDAAQTFHLLGNPFDRPFDLSGLDLTEQGFQATVSIWDPAAGTYRTVTRDDARGDDSVAVWQGFFAERGSGSATTLTFSSGGQTTGTPTFYGKQQRVVAEVPRRRLGLRLAARDGDGAEVARDEAAVLYFRDGATDGWDAWDASKPPAFAAGSPSLALVGERDGAAVAKAQEALPYDLGDAAVEVPLRFEPGSHAGSFEIAGVRWEDVPDAWQVTLTDRATGAATDLRAEGPYAFEHDAAWSGGERFSLSLDTAPLPVELAAFEAVPDGDAVRLSWRTMAEANNAGFEVQVLRNSDTERPSTGAWEVVAFVDGAGTTTEERAYRHRVEGLEPGTHRFRLRQVDLDGSAAFSAEVEATVGLAEPYRLSAVFPHPVRGEGQLTLAVQHAQDVQVALYDLLGRRVATLFDGALEAGRPHAIRLDAHALSAGLYVVRARGETFEATRTVAVVR